MNNVTIDFDKASARLSQYQANILEVVETSLKHINEKLPLSDIRILIQDKPEWVIPETGLSGFAINGHRVEIYMDPALTDFSRHIKEELPRTLAHELHHVIRWRNPGYGETLFEAMISEGLADHFDLEINNGEPRPWDTALSDEAMGKILPLATQELNMKPFAESDWFFGSKERAIPRWTGYTLGFQVVARYLKSNPSERPSTLCNVSAEKFKSSWPE